MTLPPVEWYGHLVDLAGSDSDGEVGRRGQRIRAAVHHRAVGSLESVIREFTDQSASGAARRVASHFGIGFIGTRLVIAQFIALENTAYCNGQTDRDVAALLGPEPWSVYSAVRKAAGGHVSANYFTYSIEHEDNGAAGSYVVAPETVAASIELDRLLLSGDGPAIRRAGIRCSDVAAQQLGAIVPTRDTVVDHNVAAPVSKPYCWRAIGKDPGFPQARYLAALTAPTEEEMLTFTLDPAKSHHGQVEVTIDDALAVRLDDGALIGVRKGELKEHAGFGRLEKPIGTGTGAQADRQSGWLLFGARPAWLLAYAAREVPVVVPAPDCSNEVAAENERKRTAMHAAVDEVYP